MNDRQLEVEHAFMGEDGHAAPALLSLIGAAGAIGLGIGVATDSDVLAIIGGVGVAAGLLVGNVLSHMTIDYDVYRRLEDLEKK